ncbi:MAG: hypothetical protein Q8R47_06175 [Nanoarchaeota archaeon]|nr:hypothetical protein [Nanoarchaeota archaeon]
MSPEEKKNLHYTLGALGLTALVGGAMVKYDQEIYDAGKKLMGLVHRSVGSAAPHIKSTRPLTSAELLNISSSLVKVSERGLRYDGELSCFTLDSREGITFLDTQTKEIYVLTRELFCLSLHLPLPQEIKVGTLTAKIEKNDHKLDLTLLKVERCYNCLPHFNGKIASSTSVGETFLYNNHGTSATGHITHKNFGLLTGTKYDLTNVLTGEDIAAVVIEDGKPHFIGLLMGYDGGSIHSVESLRSFIKGTPLEDELL